MSKSLSHGFSLMKTSVNTRYTTKHRLIAHYLGETQIHIFLFE